MTNIVINNGAFTYRGFMVTDIGLYGFEWFDTLTKQGKYVLTRQKAKIHYQVVRVLSNASHYKDKIIQMGLHHTDPSRNPIG